jgi:hypothetical protein
MPSKHKAALAALTCLWAPTAGMAQGSNDKVSSGRVVSDPGEKGVISKIILIYENGDKDVLVRRSNNDGTFSFTKITCSSGISFQAYSLMPMYRNSTKTRCSKTLKLVARRNNTRPAR